MYKVTMWRVRVTIVETQLIPWMLLSYMSLSAT